MSLEEHFAERLAQLRTQKGVSARDMSLSIGQSAGYINSIENKKNLPSMSCFFYICDYLCVSPQEFFAFDTPNPSKLNELISYLILLDDSQIDHLTELIKGMVK
jgi:transcriptional regulator with XRE-family HTH domain